MQNVLFRRNTAVSSVLGSVVLIAALALLQVTVVHTSPSPATTGQWVTLTRQMPINPVHIVLLNTGKVLIVSGSGNVANNADFESALWDPAHPEDPIPTQPLSWDMFCNGIAVLPDGRPIINGGTLFYDPFKGQLRSALYDPATDTFSDAPAMAHGRWYPTVTALGDGRVMTFSGLDENNKTNTTVEIFDPAGGWSAAYAAGWTPPLYPRLHLLPSGKVFYSGSGTQSRTFNPATQIWASVASTNYSGTRNYGTSVLLPLTPANGYKPQVMIMGGGNPATATTEIIDLSQSTPAWQWGPPMSQPRIEMNATILPTGTVLATGGSLNDEDAATASLNADLYDPRSGSFSSAGANTFPRLYHSNALLLPDATVLLIGGNPARGTYEHNLEIYSPAYLFNADNTPATRPSIDGVSASTLNYGGALTIQTANAADISSIVLVRPGAPTHAFDMEQRLVGLSFTAGTGVLNVAGPPDGNVAPPGYYMLFLVNSAGVPSVARFIRVTAMNQPPTAAITSPLTNVTVQAGNSVSFVGSGSDPDGTIASYSWTFPGGNPATSTLSTPGPVTYATPGTYTASLTATDNAGSTSAPVTRTITVPDFSLSATPTLQTIAIGGSATFTVGVTPGAGFAGAVTFSITGLPSGAAASFSPTVVLTSGSTSLKVTTSASTPLGNYVLAITGGTGSNSHTINVNLAVSSDFSIAVAPSSVTVAAGKNATYTVTVGAGFTGTVTLSVRGLPRTTTAKFTPASIVNAGTSTLTVSPKKNAPSGTSTLTITGTSGNTSHTTTATLVIQ